MTQDETDQQFTCQSNGVELRGAQTKTQGPPIVCLHGLTATRHYVLMGSRMLERNGFNVIGYDARAHGESQPAPRADAYQYTDLVGDLESVYDALSLDDAVLVGNSMGAATAMAFALLHPDRVRALVCITPAYGGQPPDSDSLSEWDQLADAIEANGVDGFLSVYESRVPDRFRDTVLRFTRQRLERHRDPRALAQPLRLVPRSKAFDGLDSLSVVRAPTLIVASRDEADPGHPEAVAHAYQRVLPNSQTVIEAPGKSPLAWQGAQISRQILSFLSQTASG
jgi:pimeloyl-ACP methyl ester carboxylesterase